MDLERLKEAREDLELTQSNMANNLNVSRSTYAGWENGIDSIPLLKFNDTCNLLKVSMDYIAGLTNVKTYNFINKDIDLTILSQRLKDTRIKAGDSQEDVAKIIGTTQSPYSKYELGKNTILTVFIIAFAKHYKVSIDWLCGKID
ncbi:MAG: helix-turn-helix transcriptional regulator [Bacilli bacterium]|nr:helix-turn-helix transcriptional regulator [Bacilli bacterium]